MESNFVDFAPLISGGHLESDKFLRKLVCMVKKSVHAKFCPNQMNGIKMPSENVICGIRFSRFWTFDLWRPSWILH
jgi:hypothetical protein